MKRFLIIGGITAAAGLGIYYLANRRPEPHWQVGSILTGEDPDEGWIQEKVTAVEWRAKTIFETNYTEYGAQWWYQLEKILSAGSTISSGWYPEEFLESVVIG